MGEGGGFPQNRLSPRLETTSEWRAPLQAVIAQAAALNANGRKLSDRRCKVCLNCISGFPYLPGVSGFGFLEPVRFRPEIFSIPFQREICKEKLTLK
ncbi:hypothetical protein CEXT_542431 [Caerostris extrusa]|uniref:Uncharacterized protein n=1 Tax=Caerostris extrusa TaxID=172846 RepID=A0AAV4NKS5_CAEEX|nr:hypothetical protein CEXT_542431 [Caerostris extrusa]